MFLGYSELLNALDAGSTTKLTIDTIEDAQTRMIFRLRFVHCMAWSQVAKTIGGRNTANSVKAICYRCLKSCSGA